MSPVSFTAVPGFPEVTVGTDLASLIGDGLDRAHMKPGDGDILVVAQKIVSKAEGAFVDLNMVVPGEKARAIAEITGKDPRFVEVVLSQSSDIVRMAPNLLIARHRLGYVAANAGIDRSNVVAVAGKDLVLLLPENPEKSAEVLRDRLTARFGAALAVIVSDSFGRPWRQGTVNVALGASGLPSLIDRRGEEDRNGRVLKVTEVAAADAIAGAAGLISGEGAEGTPVVLVRGLRFTAPENGAATLIRPVERDLFL